MKIEEAKTLFFAQYLGQSVISYNGDSGKLVMVGTNSSVIHGANKSPEQGNSNLTILLRSVNQLTDEEAGQVAMIAVNTCGYASKSLSQLLEIKRRSIGILVRIEGIQVELFSAINQIGICKNDNSYVGYVPTSIMPYDYLRSVGILLPFTYLNEENKPVTLQPDEIIALGWAKYQPNLV